MVKAYTSMPIGRNLLQRELNPELVNAVIHNVSAEETTASLRLSKLAQRVKAVERVVRSQQPTIDKTILLPMLKNTAAEVLLFANRRHTETYPAQVQTLRSIVTGLNWPAATDTDLIDICKQLDTGDITERRFRSL